MIRTPANHLLMFVLIAALTALAVGSSGAEAQSIAAPGVAIPNTPAGTVFADWLSARNSGDATQLKAFNDRYHQKIPIESAIQQREMSGGWLPIRIDTSTDRKLSVTLKEKESDSVLGIDLTLRTTSPPEIETLAPRYFQEIPPDLAPGRLTERAALDAVVARADELAREDRFSGGLLIARQEKILVEKKWGLADRATGKPVVLNTQFRLGSMNKMFTAVGILQLVAVGKVSLQGTVGTYLSDYPNKNVAEKVTVRELLNHTGGTGDIFGPEFDAHRDTLKENSDYVKLYGARGLDHEPGKEDHYSNYGFVLLGSIIERVSGQSYYDYVDKHIFQPTGMHSTGSPPESAKVTARAVGYMKRNGDWVDDSETLPYRGMAAGGGVSTLGDLFKFAQALQAGSLIPLKLLHDATQPQNNMGWYGYGFIVGGSGTLHHYGHEGGAPGMNGMLEIYPDLGVVIVALSNLDPPAADHVADYYALRMPIEP